jgi:hypothetical protein
MVDCLSSRAGGISALPHRRLRNETRNASGVLPGIVTTTRGALTGGMKKMVSKSPILRNDGLAVLLSLFLSLGLLPALWLLIQRLI